MVKRPAGYQLSFTQLDGERGCLSSEDCPSTSIMERQEEEERDEEEEKKEGKEEEGINEQHSFRGNQLF